MATSINNVIAVNVPVVNSGVAAAARTFTTTRQLRVFDMKAVAQASAGAASTLTVSNAASTITSVASVNPPGANTVYRLGNELAPSTLNDATMVVPAGGTIVFGASTVDTFDMTAYCFST